MQFAWGVFWEFSKDIELEDTLKKNLPISEGYTELGKKDSQTQHKLANIEIIAWNSSYTAIYL